jgi:release factor glutamine methyltransferase
MTCIAGIFFFFWEQVLIEPLVASLAHPLSSRLGHAVDILVFNPPYVPTSDEEVDAAQIDAGIAGSWAGGTDGMQVTDALLRQVDVSVFCIDIL